MPDARWTLCSPLWSHRVGKVRTGEGLLIGLSTWSPRTRVVGEDPLHFIRDMLDAGVDLFLPGAEAKYADSC